MKIDPKNQQVELGYQVIAKRITSLLDEQASNIDAKAASKLSYARQQALANMAKPSSGMSISQNGVIRLFGKYWYQQRLLLEEMGL